MVNKKNTFLEKVRYLWRHSFYRLSDTLSVELLITDPRIFQQFPTLQAVKLLISMDFKDWIRYAIVKVSMTASAVAEEFHLKPAKQKI